MRGGNKGMNKNWSSGNSYLRLLSSLRDEPKKRMIFCTQSVQELQSALEATQQFVEVMIYGVELHVVIKKQSKNVGIIEVFVEDSKEMS